MACEIVVVHLSELWVGFCVSHLCFSQWGGMSLPGLSSEALLGFSKGFHLGTACSRQGSLGICGIVGVQLTNFQLDGLG